MAGSIPASATAEPAGEYAPRRTCLAVGRGVAALPAATGWRSSSLVVLALMVLAVLLGPAAVAARDQRDRLHRAAGAARRSAHPFGTDDLGRDILARMLYGGRISLAVGLAAMLMAIFVGVLIGAIAGISRGSVDAALMWVTDLFLSLPQLPLLLMLIYLFRDTLKGDVRARGRHLHPDRRGDRRLSLDAGGAPGARAVLLVAREGVRRSRARARRVACRARWCGTSCRMRSGR